MPYRSIKQCRLCGSQYLRECLTLGDFAVSGFAPDNLYEFERVPLVLVRCEKCTLVQLRDTTSRDQLYSQYWYRSGTQPAMVRALKDVVRDAASRVVLRPGDVVLDIGANDGTLLAQYSELKWPNGKAPARLPGDYTPKPALARVAYEPATQFWDIMRAKNIRVAGRYFPHFMDGKPVGLEPKAKIITSIACFYDVDDPNAFVEGIKANLADDGIWINQMSYFPKTVETLNFGDICHEHLTYWDLHTIAELMHRNGFTWTHSFNDVNGGSIRTVAVKSTKTCSPSDLKIEPITVESIKLFERRVKIHSLSMWREIQQIVESGGKVIGYGASTKGNTYLQYWGIGPELVQYIADRNKDKVGKWTPTGQQIISEKQMRRMRPDYLLMLPFHFRDSFLLREQHYLRDGGKFIIPFPQIEGVGAECLSTLVPHSEGKQPKKRTIST